jgi:lipoprotein signal peptidase
VRPRRRRALLCGPSTSPLDPQMNSSTRRQAWVVLALVAIDAFVKIAAFRGLPLDEPIRQCFLCVVLRVNVLSLGSAAQSLMASQGFRVFVTSAVFSGVLALALLIAGTKRPLTGRSIALSVLAALLSGAAFFVLFPTIGRAPSPATVAAARAGVVSLWLVIWVLSTSPLWKLGALLWSAAGASNLLSLAYPPYHVIDYLWSTPLNRLIGIGVFNIADVFWLLGFLVFAIALIVYVARRVGFGRRQLGAMRV